jgi:hypothetical protein
MLPTLDQTRKAEVVFDLAVNEADLDLRELVDTQ